MIKINRFKILLLMSLYSIFTNASSFAATLCVDVMTEKPAARFTEKLTGKLLRENQFRLEGDRLIDLTDNTVVGSVEILNPTHLYQWAPQAYHDVWIEHGGVSPHEMDLVLKEPAQTYGIGYYVSINPFDSRRYGPALTVFKTRTRIVRVRPLNDLEQLSKFDRLDFVQRLIHLGVDATGSHSTWLTMISTRHLKTEDDLISDPIWTTAEGLQFATLISARLKNSNLLAQLPAEIATNQSAVQKAFRWRMKTTDFKNFVTLEELNRDFNALEPAHQTSLWPSYFRKLSEAISLQLPIQQVMLIRGVSALKDYSLMVRLVSAGVNLNLDGFSGFPLLHYILLSGDHELVKQLVELGAEVNGPRPEGSPSLLEQAAQQNMKQTLRYFLRWRWTKAELREAFRKATDPEIKAILQNRLRGEKAFKDDKL